MFLHVPALPVFPQFGAGPLPQHGFARNSLWSLGETKVVQNTGDISSELFLEDSEATRAVWPHAFRLTLTVLLKPTSLSMQLRVENRNADGGKAFNFTTLLHTYLGVDSIEKTTVRGLHHAKFIDQLDGGAQKEQNDELLTFRGEVDRKYLNVNSARVLDGGNCEMVVKTTGFRDLVLWNPHVKKTAGFADMPPEDWKKFVCVEAGVVHEPIELAAGATWEAAQGLSIALLPELQRTVAEQSLAKQKL
jgi:glucose-6-phosphate 1-epimerase